MLANEQSLIELVILKFKVKFEVRISKRVDQALGISIADNADRVKLHNMPMLGTILDHLKMSECSPVSTLLPAGLDLSCEIGNKMQNSPPHRQIIGARVHLADTVRPDISYAEHYLARIMHKSTRILWTAGKQILRHLEGTKSLGVLYHHGYQKRGLKAYSNAD